MTTERERLLEWEVERLQQRCAYLANHLHKVYSVMTPENVRLPDGRCYEFNNPAIEHEMLQELCKYIREIPAALAASKEPIVADPAPTLIWYMRDNHTFRALPLDVEGAILAMREERDAGHAYGMLCSKHPMLLDSIHTYDAARWDAFEHFARPWLERAVAIERGEQ